MGRPTRTEVQARKLFVQIHIVVSGWTYNIHPLWNPKFFWIHSNVVYLAQWNASAATRRWWAGRCRVRPCWRRRLSTTCAPTWPPTSPAGPPIYLRSRLVKAYIVRLGAAVAFNLFSTNLWLHFSTVVHFFETKFDRLRLLVLSCLSASFFFWVVMLIWIAPILTSRCMSVNDC